MTTSPAVDRLGEPIGEAAWRVLTAAEVLIASSGLGFSWGSTLLRVAG